MKQIGLNIKKFNVPRGVIAEIAFAATLGVVGFVICMLVSLFAQNA